VVLVSSALVPIESITEAWENPPEPEPVPAVAPPTDEPPAEPETLPPAGPVKSGRLTTDQKPATGDITARQEVITKRALDSRANLQRNVRMLKSERAMQGEWRKAIGVASRKTVAAMSGVTSAGDVQAAVKSGMAGLSERLAALAETYHGKAAIEGKRSMVEIAGGKMGDSELDVWKAGAKWGPATAAFIDTRKNLIKGMIDKDLFADIVAASKEAVIGGIEQAKLTSLVQDRFLHGQGGATRAVTIARTEIGSAYSVSRHEEMRGQGFERHQWLTAQDDGVRDGSEPGEFDHSSSNGEVRNVDGSDGAFPCGLNYPMEAGGKAGNVINCRCETIPLIAGMEGF